MALGVGEQGIIYLLKATGLNEGDLHNKVKEFIMRPEEGEGGYEGHDWLINKVLEWCRSKSISDSMLLAKWESYVFNIQAFYVDPEWVLGKGEKAYSEDGYKVSNQSELDKVMDEAYNNLEDEVTVVAPLGVLSGLDFTGVSANWVLREVGLGSMPYDITGMPVFTLTFEAGVDVDGWGGVCVSDAHPEMVDFKRRYTESSRLWEESSIEAGENRRYWNAALQGFEMASLYGKAYTKVKEPVTVRDEWDEAILSAIALGGIYGGDLEKWAGRVLWTKANPETKGYCGEKPGEDEGAFEKLAERVNTLAWVVGVA